MIIYISRSNKLGSPEFERAKKIVKQDFPDCVLQWHNKSTPYNPTLIIEADLVVFITDNNGLGIGRGQAQQIDACIDNNIKFTWLNIYNIDDTLLNRIYSAMKKEGDKYEIKDKEQWDNRYADILPTYKSIYPLKTEKKIDKRPLMEANEIDPEDIQIATMGEIAEDITDGACCAIPYYNILHSTNINSQKQTTHGKTIKVSRITPTIRRGKERKGCTVHGRGSEAIIGIGHLSDQEISGRQTAGAYRKDINSTVRLSHYRGGRYRN